MIQCQICKNQFIPRNPKKPAKTCSKICKNGLASQITNKQFSDPANREIQRQKSLDQKKDPEYQKKHKDAMIARTARWEEMGHPRIGMHHSDIAKQRISEKATGRFKGKTWEEIMGKQMANRRREENSIFMATTNETLLKEKRSKLEDSLIPYLPEYENNIRISKYTVDFINKNTKHIIEVYGDYWHCNPEIYPDDFHHHYFNMPAVDRRKLDEDRVKHLESLGYSVTIVWESNLTKFIKDLKT
jgi:G:T-mismatch repair DNA endonuclease (very short patch repair protein)